MLRVAANESQYTGSRNLEFLIDIKTNYARVVAEQ